MVKNRLKYWRERAGFKYKKHFAEWLGLDHRQYNRYENQRVQPDIETLLYIFGKLKMEFPDIHLEDLIERD